MHFKMICILCFEHVKSYKKQMFVISIEVGVMSSVLLTD